MFTKKLASGVECQLNNRLKTVKTFKLDLLGTATQEDKNIEIENTFSPFLFKIAYG